jgi:uncharacterized protein involved in outer membrane biogenesis
LRKVLIAFGAVLALLVAAVLVGPSFVDWNAQKDRIVAEVQRATGREFSIQGDMSLSLLPVPALSAQGVRLASIEGGSAEPMVDLKELRVRVALLPLIEGTVQVERILLVEPKILLEVLPDGRRNWSFADGNGTDGAIGPGASNLNFRFDDVSIEKGTLIYRDMVGGRDRRIDDLDLRIVAESLRGPFAAKGSLRVQDIAGAFEGTVGRLVEDGATPFNVVVKPAGETARLQLSGAISTHPDTVAVHGRLKGEGDNLARLIDGLTGGHGGWPAVLAQDFTVEGEVSLDPPAVSVSDISLELGNFRFAGDMTSLLAPPYDARITLAASQLDLDHLKQAKSSESGGDGQAVATPSEAEAPRQAWVLPADASGRLEFSVEALIFRGQLIRQLRIDAAVAGGELELERAMALLPGSSDISLSGILRETGGEAEFNGHLEAASDNLRGLLQWVGADISAVPPDRLRRMSLSGRLTGTPKQIAISDLDLRLDLTRVSGGLVIAPRRRLGFGVGLALDSINLDAYLPGEEAGVAGTAGSVRQQAGAAGAPAGIGLELLDRFDANLNLRAGAVTLYGVTAKDLQVDATLQQGVLEFRTARVGNLDGGEVNYLGRVDKIGTHPSLDGSLQLSVNEPARLAPLFGLDPAALVRVPAFTGEGRISGDLEKLDLDAQISGGGGRLEVAGTVQPTAAPLAFDLRLAGRHPNLAALLEMAGRPLPSGSDLGVLDLALRVAGDPGRFQISELKGALGPANVSGGFAVAVAGAGPAVSDLDVLVDARHPDVGRLAYLTGLTERPPNGLGDLDLHARLSGGPARVRMEELEAGVGPVRLSGAAEFALAGLAPALAGYDLYVTARHPDLAGLAAGLGLGALSGEGIGGLDLTARVQGDRNRARIEDLKGRLGPVDLSGRVSADLGGARPAFVADLETGDVPLDALFPGAPDGGAKQGADEGAHWPRDAIDPAGLRSFDARVNLRATALTHDTLRVDQVALSANLKAGVLDLERFTGTVHGGSVQLAGKLDLREEPAASFAVTAIEVDLGEVLRNEAGFDRISGPVFFNGDFTARGSSEAELVATLEGTAELSGLLTFKPAPGEDSGGSLPGPEHDTDLLGLLVRALGRDPVRLAGSIKAEAGLLRTEDTRLDGQPAYALTQATVDLPGWTLEGVTEIYERSTGQPLISSLAFGGPLDAPELERPQPSPSTAPDIEEPKAPVVSETAKPEASPAEPQEGDAPAALPSEPQPVAPAPAPKPTAPTPAVPTPPQPDDLLKDLLKLGS